MDFNETGNIMFEVQNVSEWLAVFSSWYYCMWVKNNQNQ